MKKHTHSFLRILPLLLLLALSACSARQIREAQSAFNQASARENEVRAQGVGAGAFQLQQAAAGDYRQALGMVETELDDCEAELRGDRLYGTALMIKAYCLWRLADLDNFDEPDVATAKTQKDLGQKRDPADELTGTLAQVRAELAANRINLGERDKAMLVALPGLRDHDRGLRATDYETAKRFFDSAIDVVARGQKEVPKGHPVQVYLLMAQLSTCRAWIDAAWTLPNADGTPVSNSIGAQRVPEVTRRADTILQQLVPLANDPLLKKQITDFAIAIGTSNPFEAGDDDDDE